MTTRTPNPGTVFLREKNSGNSPALYHKHPTCSGTLGRRTRSLATPPEAAPAARRRGESGCRPLSACRTDPPPSDRPGLRGLPAKRARCATFSRDFGERTSRATATAGAGRQENVKGSGRGPNKTSLQRETAHERAGTNRKVLILPIHAAMNGIHRVTLARSGKRGALVRESSGNVGLATEACRCAQKKRRSQLRPPTATRSS